MYKFVTESGSTYFVDRVENKISGGKLLYQVRFKFARIMIGDRAYIELENGQVLSTSNVLSY